MEHSELTRLLEGCVSATDIALLLNEEPLPKADDYGTVVERAIAKSRGLQSEVSRNRERVRLRYRELVDAPEGRKQTLLRNGHPAMLTALVRDLVEQSYKERFHNPARSLELAELGVRTAVLVGEAAYPSPESAADLRGEALGHLANARRINSDVVGAHEALHEAEKWLNRGTRDRLLKAEFFSFRASLASSEGLSADAAVFFDREICLLRSTGDRARLGTALVNRGIIAAWNDPFNKCCDLLEEGVHLVDDPKVMMLALHALAERLARDGKGLEAWKVVCAAETVSTFVQGRKFELRLRWIKGITYRALDQLSEAAEELTAVRDAFLEERILLQAALATLDLASVRASQGRFAEVRQLAEEAHRAFVAEGLERRALAAFLVLYRAARAERATEALTLEVANYLARYQHNRKLRFERAEPW